MSSEFGKLAAERQPGSDVMRLVGTATLSFVLRPKKKGTARAMLTTLGGLVAATCRAMKYPKNTFETWNRAGEPQSRGLVPVGRLITAVRVGDVICDQAWGETWLEEANALVLPDGPWKMPLARVICRCPEDVGPGNKVTLVFNVYFGRLLFELIACEHIKKVMEHLTPAATVSPVYTPPEHPPVFTSHSTGAADARPGFIFTLPGLLKACEHSGYSEAPAPSGLLLKMFPFQKQTLSWMMDQENLPGGLNALFWERRQWQGSPDVWWYFPLAGELRLKPPPLVYGGLLAEQMGLGKTLEVTALVLSDKQRGFPNPPMIDLGFVNNDKESKACPLVKSNSTLIVVPSTLLAQWEKEFSKCAACGSLSFISYHEAKSFYDKDFTIPLLEELSGHDVVLTTYKTLEDEAGSKARGKKRSTSKVLMRVHWRRIVLDECQMVRSSTTSLAKACRALKGNRRWMVSGTPLHSSVDDLNGELLFLGVWPFSFPDSQDGFWEHRIGKPWENKDPESLDLLHSLMGKIAMRHTKSQTTLDGRSLLELPAATHSLYAVDMNENLEENPSHVHFLYVYKFLEAKAMQGFTILRDWEEADSRCSDAEMLFRLLREICTYPPYTKTMLKTTLKSIDSLLRGIERSAGVSYIDRPSTLKGLDAKIRSTSAEEVLRALMQPRTAKASAADKRAGLVRNGGTSVSNYHTARKYAQSSVKVKLAEALQKVYTLEAQCAPEERKHLARLRWLWAGKVLLHGGALIWRMPIGLLRRTFANLQTSRVKQPGSTLKKQIVVLKEAIDKAQGELARLRPYVELLQKAVSYGGAQSDFHVVEQSGFQGIHDIMEGRPAPTCPICYQEAQEPTVTPCAHIACCECICHWLQAAQLVSNDLDHFDSEDEDQEDELRATCPLCRKIFQASTLLRILPPEKPKEPPASHASEAGPSRRKRGKQASESIGLSEESGPKKGKASLAAICSEEPVPEWCPAATEQDHETIKVPGVIPMRRDPTVPAVPGMLLTHLHTAAASISPKVQAVLKVLRIALKEEGGKAKAVVVSQHVAAVNHLTDVLNDHGIGAVKIVGAMPESERRQAIQKFNSSTDIKVFVLHAGQAGAGLTLTIARTLILLEPFASPGDEAQAMNRCHRIGQTRSVNCITFYVKGTVEERMLAYRSKDRAFGASATVNSSGLTSAGASGESSSSSAKRKQKGKQVATAPYADDALATVTSVEQGTSMDPGQQAHAIHKLRFVLGLAQD